MDVELTPSCCEPDRTGVVVRVRVIPRSGRSGLAGTRADALLVRLGAAPVDGAANAELVAILGRSTCRGAPSPSSPANARGRSGCT